MTYEKSYEEKKKKARSIQRDVNIAEKENIAAKTRSKTRAVARHALESDNIKVVAAVNDVPKVRTIKAKRNMPFPTSVVFVSVICTVLFMFMMLTMAQINEFTQDISALQNRLSELQKQEEELRLDVELKNDLRVIEDAAVNKLGMVKADEVKKQYVVIGNEDKIEVVEPETTEDSLINTVMSSIGENFRELVEYIN
ncbi:MAG: septum formation initiator family protein [Clostridia bacterium]|nr:septum formation initiator family protein [Clostridia bacterium]